MSEWQAARPSLNIDVPRGLASVIKKLQWSLALKYNESLKRLLLYSFPSSILISSLIIEARSDGNICDTAPTEDCKRLQGSNYFDNNEKLYGANLCLDQSRAESGLFSSKGLVKRKIL